jgi:hypothetical protein
MSAASMLSVQGSDWLGDAHISECGRYRYLLKRWRPGGTSRGVLWIMLNPSTADAMADDATIRKVRGFTARLFGADAFTVVNLFALRSRDPKALRAVSREEAIGPACDTWLRHELGAAQHIVCAWGSHGELHRRGADVMCRLVGPWLHLDVKAYRLSTTKNGEPGHPLMLCYDTPLVELDRFGAPTPDPSGAKRGGT